MKKVYDFVPLQDFSKVYTDEDLYKKYGLSQTEINFIENSIKPQD
jgi:site-specific DNA-methyltransferase (adenine-specific)